MMTGKGAGKGVARVVGCAIAALVSLAGAARAADFQTRAAGRVFQCGAQVVEFPRDGTATLSGRDTPAILTATKTKWYPHRVKLTFGRGSVPIKLSEFGTTVTLVAPGRSAVCIGVR